MNKTEMVASIAKKTGLTKKDSEKAVDAFIKTIQEGLKAKDGYCPCRMEKTPDTKCICKEFKQQIKDPDFEGFCHCMLYYKSK